MTAIIVIIAGHRFGVWWVWPGSFACRRTSSYFFFCLLDGIYFTSTWVSIECMCVCVSIHHCACGHAPVEHSVSLTDWREVRRVSLARSSFSLNLYLTLIHAHTLCCRETHCCLTHTLAHCCAPIREIYWEDRVDDACHKALLLVISLSSFCLHSPSLIFLSSIIS